MNELTSRIDKAISKTMAGISKAAERRDVTVIEHLTKQASELRALAEQITAIEKRLEHLDTSGSATNGSTPRSPIRELVVEVSQGMINQNLLTLSSQIKRGIVRTGESFRIRAIPSGDVFETELLASGNKLQERGKIAKFYRDASIRAGDSVVLREITPGQWELGKWDIIRTRRQ